ncbi:MAG: hypothetical protein GY925_13415, partial [Actinomycetia bacterium]|nr:hypothetical protein [Actinomycetes bacterium]
RDGEDQSTTPDGVVLDDVLVISTGDQIVADGVIITDGGIELDESLLTGESDPVRLLHPRRHGHPLDRHAPFRAPTWHRRETSHPIRQDVMLKHLRRDCASAVGGRSKPRQHLTAPGQ